MPLDLVLFSLSFAFSLAPLSLHSDKCIKTFLNTRTQLSQRSNGSQREKDESAQADPSKENGLRKSCVCAASLLASSRTHAIEFAISRRAALILAPSAHRIIHFILARLCVRTVAARCTTEVLPVQCTAALYPARVSGYTLLFRNVEFGRLSLVCWATSNCRLILAHTLCISLSAFIRK